MNLKQIIKANVASNSLLMRWLVSVYHLSKYRWWRPPTLHSKSITEILDRYSQVKQVKFVQIGSNDGLGGDPLRQFIIRDRWEGILVEPLPDTFRKLLKNYEEYEHKADLYFENVAISDKNELKTFYYIDAKKAKVSESTANKFSSFHKEIPLKYKYVFPGFENSICELEIKALTLNMLLEKHHLKEDLDLLHIDAEGHDYEIIKQIDFNITKPSIILFESCHLGLSDYKKCINSLKNNNYVLFELDLDTIAIQREYQDILLSDRFARKSSSVFPSIPSKYSSLNVLLSQRTLRTLGAIWVG